MMAALDTLRRGYRADQATELLCERIGISGYLGNGIEVRVDLTNKLWELPCDALKLSQ